MVHDHKRLHFDRGESIGERGSCALIVYEDRSLILPEIVAFAVAHHFKLGQLNEGQVLLMTDPAFIDDVALDTESWGDQLVSPGARDSIRVGIVLHHDGVAFSTMHFK